jgi:hypothetical protein
MNRELLITIEIMLIVNVPLLYLYLKRTWPLRTIIVCLLSIPVLWYLTYALLHELGHIAGTYVAGGRVIDYKLVPRFWAGEFGTAWITPDGLTHTWQQLLSTSFPYILNVVSMLVGIFVLQRRFLHHPFVIGLLFMLFCLRPAFDFVSELTGFLSGFKGDVAAIQSIIGSTLTWSFISLSLGLSFFSIIGILRRFVGSPEGTVVDQGTQGERTMHPG